jgi:hypothetical protein
LLAGFTSVEQLDDELHLGANPDGTAGWLTSRRSRARPGPVDDQPPAQDPPETEVATPSAQPPEDGRL